MQSAQTKRVNNPHTHRGRKCIAHSRPHSFINKKCVYRYDFGITVDDVICFKTSYDLGVTVASP